MKHDLLFNAFQKSFLALLLLAVTVGYGQNKSLGVGTTTPNPNAALHVESPTSNQGMIIPRLTTTQRLAMTLGTGDVGLLVYDSDLKEVISWTGSAWDTGRRFESNDTTATIHVVNNGTMSATDVAGSAAILAETTTAFSAITGRIPASAAQGNAISGITKSTDPGSWAGYFDAQTGTAVYGVTRSNVGGALAPVGVYGESRGTASVGGAFWIQNAANNYPALYTNTIGVGPSLHINVDNASNSAPAVVINHAGTGLALTTSGTIQAGQFQGDGSLLTNLPAISLPFEAQVNGDTTLFYVENTNAGSTSPAVYGKTNGAFQVKSVGVLGETSSGFAGVRGVVTAGSGNGIVAESTSPSVGSWAFLASSINGSAGRFQSQATAEPTVHINNNNPLSAQPSLEVQADGTGAAALFNQVNSGAISPALEVNTDGQSEAIFATTTGTGHAAMFVVSNPTSATEAFKVSTDGLAATASFENTNPSFNGSAIRSTVNTDVAGNALEGVSQGTKGHGGSFFVQNAVNPDPAVTIFTQGQGVGLQAGSLTNGIAIEVANGTVRYSTNTTGIPGNITQRAGVYNITANGTYTLDYPSPQEGETTYIYNSSGTSVTVNGTLIADAQLKQYIYIVGAWRTVN